MNSVIERSFFPVKKIQTDENRYSIVNLETQCVISEVTERYTLIHNRDLVQPFLDKFGADSVRSYRKVGNKFIYKIATSEDIDIGDGDILKPMVTIVNSYDKTASYKFCYGFMRKVCSNGLYAPMPGNSFRKIHVGIIPVHEMVQDAIQKGQSPSIEVWRNLKAVPLTVERKLEIINGFEAFKIKEKNPAMPYHIKTASEIKNERIKWWAKREAEKNTNLLDNQPNAWGLLNNINYGIARTVKNPLDSIRVNIEIEDYLSKICLN